ncbi:MAG: hypothetical protein AB2777_09135, partial [Candidatus Thiodiazotropha endolucinida]
MSNTHCAIDRGGISPSKANTLLSSPGTDVVRPAMVARYPASATLAGVVNKHIHLNTLVNQLPMQLSGTIVSGQI